MDESQRTVAGVTVIDTPAEGTPAGWRFVYAPGAGSNVHDPFGTYACQRLAALGVPSSRFQFPYHQAKAFRPDPPGVLEQTWGAVLDACRLPNTRTVIGGRSMGGRIATMIVANGAPVDGLVAFAYPLHQPNKPDRARTSHLSAIHVPTLFVSGTRDTFGTPEELALATAVDEGSTLHLLDGADHSFAVLKRGGRTKDEVYAEAVDALIAFVEARGLRG